MKTCSVEGCGNKYRARGYCSTHYSHWLKERNINLVTHPHRANMARTLSDIMQRCYNPNHKEYKDYGGRGITVCDRWRFGENHLHGFECFMTDMGDKPSTEYSIDRIDNDKGYSPDNCRWATPTQQIGNRRKNKNNTSGYIGVFWHKQGLAWVAYIGRTNNQSKSKNLGLYKDKIEAAKAYDRWVIANRDTNATTNFPREQYLD